MKDNVSEIREIMNKKLNDRIMTPIRKDKLSNILTLFNRTLEVPKGCDTSASLLMNPANPKEQIVRFTFDIPVDLAVPLIQKWNGWKNAYKYRRR